MQVINIKPSHHVDDGLVNKVTLSNGLDWYTLLDPNSVRRTVAESSPAATLLVGVTYSDSTPESVEIGDFDDVGWLEETTLTTLGELINIIESNLDGGFENFNRNAKTTLDLYSSDSYTIDYSEGRDRSVCVHINGTERDIKRVKKYLINKYNL